MYVKIIGRVSNGVQDTGYKVIVDDGSVTNVTMDYIANWAVQGVIVNALIDRGNIVINDYTNLPVFSMNAVDGRSFDNKNKAVIIAQIVDNGVVIGYEIMLPNGRLKRYAKKDVIGIIKQGVKFVNKLKVVNNNIVFNEYIFNVMPDGTGIPYNKKVAVATNNTSNKVVNKKEQYTSNFDIKDGKLLKVRSGALENGVLKIPEGVTEIANDAVYDLDISVLILPESLKKLGSVADDIFNYYKLKSVKAPARFIDIFYNPRLEYFNDFIIEVDGGYFFKEDYSKASYLLGREIDRNPRKVQHWCNEAGVDFEYSEYDERLEVYDEEEVIKYILFEYYQEVDCKGLRHKAKELGIFEFEII